MPFETLVVASGARHQRVAPPQLELDSDLMFGSAPFSFDNDDDENDEQRTGQEKSSSLSETAFRCDGITIGNDYLRYNGVTISRGCIHPCSIDVHDVIGRGAFSTVRRAQWKRIVSAATSSSSSSSSKLPSTSRVLNSNDCCKEQVPPNQQVDETDCRDSLPLVEVETVAVKEWSIGDDHHHTFNYMRQHQNMLLQELRALCSLTSISPALVQLHGAFLTHKAEASDAVVTVVMEYMDRGSLQDYLERQRRDKHVDRSSIGTCCASGLSENLIAPILYQMLTGLAALHAPERRLLHRDLKPANVLLHSNGSVKLCDFGLATTTDGTAAANTLNDETVLHRTVLGTAQFMAPERLRAQPYGRSSDIWSLGLIVWQCITGQVRPFFDSMEEGCGNDDDHRNQSSQNYSMVDLLVTMEEMTVADLVESFCRRKDKSGARNSLSSGLQEILTGCLQLEPAKRIPASLLLQSPWFLLEHKIQTLQHALDLVCKHL